MSRTVTSETQRIKRNSFIISRNTLICHFTKKQDIAKYSSISVTNPLLDIPFVFLRRL
ncbi:hypothetical protein [Dysgonomonas sp. HGC4]|uniref:hypothetical protein n=1 Tax=Dysgonomonas sp. HGC4 TaxID=1658009 RepID=UPI0012F8AA4B|nr:hypothetical protein [Dysgonomonas sp. HGC4]MBD8347878.1 hypothetical protein [Dysgonomonas sp. HGC4]